MDIVRREASTLITLRAVGRRSELSHRVPLAWIELERRLGEIDGRVQPGVFYGVVRERDHAGGGDATYVYSVGVEVAPEPASIPSGMRALVVPRGRYAMAACRGGADAIERAYVDLARATTARGLEVDRAGLGLERYDITRQPPTPPYERFDYDILRPLIE